MVLIAAILSIGVGVVLGMLGGGGAILTLPMLVYVAGVEPKAAIAMSLFVVGSTSIVGASINARAGLVQWRTGLLFGTASMAGAFLGGRLGSFVPAAVLLVLFAVLMLVTALAMMRGRAGPPQRERHVAIGRILLLGSTVGVLSGLVGAGGGFVIVPALTLFGGLALREAIGTSLFVIALSSFAGFAGHVGHVAVDWRLMAVVTSATVLGSAAGVVIGKRVSPDRLRRSFAWLVLAMGFFVIGKQVPFAVTAAVATVALAAVVVVTRRRTA